MDFLIAAQLVVNRNAEFEPPLTQDAEDRYYRTHESGAWARWWGRARWFKGREASPCLCDVQAASAGN
jgi:hypothetical protein